MPVWTIPPNWSGQIRERIEWFTDIVMSHNETETRYPMRIWPRRSLEFSILVNGDDLAVLDGLIWEWQAQKFDLPIWTDVQDLPSELLTGASQIFIDTDYYDFEDGGKAILYASPTSYEMVDIDTVGSGVLNLLGTVANDWPLGTNILPIRQARLNKDVQTSKPTTHTMTGVIRFDLDPSDYVANPGGTLYNGVEVFEGKNNWVNPVTGNYLRKTQTLDYRTGDVFVDDVSGISTVVRSYKTLLKSRQEIAEWRGWGYARQGKYSPFWMNQDQIAFNVVSDIADTDTTIDIKEIGAVSAYLLETGRLDIALQTTDGTWHYRRITNIIDGAFGTEIITIDSAFGVNIPISQINISTWFMLSRLDADVLSITWHSRSVADSTINMRSVKA